ncbi:dehydrogenase [Zobellia amurskyensis]|uniref:Dehydrogenase n=1 Tax=Zobellia amurskyensis TaxID=248905 RepID=A0A7X2ZX33_9FLAO|nr:c-type cytochrome [Zobellia amurskyensis]MUH37972.1 dehydrogenase [Zobellia amurskyensis]
MKYFKSPIFFGTLLILLTNCNTSYDEPRISLEGYEVESGFELDVVASEPFLKAPVAIDFDNQGRIWVVQMPGYMNDMQGSDETKPNGSIDILQDLDNDGVVDHTKTFLDSLVMPRALAHVYGGLLYSEPPFLYFTEIEDDKPVNRVVVDSIYAVEGNPEHQPNGLMMNIDNWIYNAKSNFRYRRENGVWKKEATTFRGQWGISHDNFGRLYFNDNSRQLLGDHVLPNVLVRNKYFTPGFGVNRMLTDDQRVYPKHATTVNRGYAKGVLNQDSILVKATAACAPLVYRGGGFSSEYNENVFVCIPEGNLIKRNILTFTGDSTIAKQAYENKEFLTSTDEGFRPVNLNNGPDGSMYVTDMHRGMIGHHAYLSPYLKKKVAVNKLDTLTNFGRILRVKKLGQINEPVRDFNKLSSMQLVALLKDKNGWVRDRAQQLLVYKQKKDGIEELKQLVFDTQDPIAQLHALYALEGLNALSYELLSNVAVKGNAELTAHALVLVEPFLKEAGAEKSSALIMELLAKNNVTVDLYLSSIMGSLVSLDKERFLPIMEGLSSKYSGKPIFTEALVSGVGGKEEMLGEALASNNKMLAEAIAISEEKRKEEKVNPIFARKSLVEDTRTSGAKMFYEICASCHGVNGQGIEGLAPPLMGSEHVANTERLGLIILHGLEGPITVKGKRYDLNLAMPGLIRNEDISNKDIADIISYVTNAFSDVPRRLKLGTIEELRNTKPESGAEYTEQELLDYFKK